MKRIILALAILFSNYCIFAETFCPSYITCSTNSVTSCKTSEPGFYLVSDRRANVRASELHYFQKATSSPSGSVQYNNQALCYYIDLSTNTTVTFASYATNLVADTSYTPSYWEQSTVVYFTYYNCVNADGYPKACPYKTN